MPAGWVGCQHLRMSLPSPCLPGWPWDVATGCTLWVVINALFELGQALPAQLVQHLPVPLKLRAYFTHGVFDPLDLAACAIGAWVAWIVLRNRTLQNDKDQTGIDREYISMRSKNFKSREV